MDKRGYIAAQEPGCRRTCLAKSDDYWLNHLKTQAIDFTELPLAVFDHNPGKLPTCSNFCSPDWRTGQPCEACVTLNAYRLYTAMQEDGLGPTDEDIKYERAVHLNDKVASYERKVLLDRFTRVRPFRPR